MDIIKTFLNFSLLGSQWVMWVLVALSLVSITVMIERGICFFGQRQDVTRLIEELKKLLSAGDFKTARERIGETKGFAPIVASVALAEAERGVEAVSEAAAGSMAKERLRLERNLVFLGTVGNNAPFIGLFGTVIGIIRAFHDLSKNAQGGVETVMAGVSEALVATAIGLLVAIPAVIAFNMYQRRIKTLTGDADAVIHAILSGLSGQRNVKGAH